MHHENQWCAHNPGDTLSWKVSKKSLYSDIQWFPGRSLLITLGICRWGQLIGKNKEVPWVLEACERLVGVGRKEIACSVGKNEGA